MGRTASRDDYLKEWISEGFDSLRGRLDDMQKAETERKQMVLDMDFMNKAEFKAQKDRIMALESKFDRMETGWKVLSALILSFGAFIGWSADIIGKIATFIRPN